MTRSDRVVAIGGGSSGRLRRDLGIIAPGNLRRCLQALAPAGLLTEAVGHRFEIGELEGHPPGNVLGALVTHGVAPSAVLVDVGAAAEDVMSGVEIVRAPVHQGSDQRHDIELLAGALQRYPAVTVSRSHDRNH